MLFEICQRFEWQSHSTMRNLVHILRARYKIVYFISAKHQQALFKRSDFVDFLQNLALPDTSCRTKPYHSFVKIFPPDF